jgi:hypothetical protein
MMALWGHSTRVKNLLRFFRKRRENKRKFRLEVSDEDEAQTEANLTVHIAVNHVENVFTV